MTTTEQFDTIIIGAGQAGLATGYHLARQGQKFVILEGHDQVGDVWRKRYDSLRLYTPSQYNGLPGMPMPLPRWSFPGRDDMASYLESYSSAFDLPVRTGARVDGLAKAHGRYIVSCGEQLLEADNVVIASGGWQQPKTPDFAVELDPQICQLHSSAYRNPDQLQEGPVLIVGCSHSGADLALELAETHQVTLSGPVRGEIPFDIEGRVAHLAVPLLWFAANHVLTQRTPIGRKMRAEVRQQWRSPPESEARPPRGRRRGALRREDRGRPGWQAGAGGRAGARCPQRHLVHGVRQGHHVDELPGERS